MSLAVGQYSAARSVSLSDGVRGVSYRFESNVYRDSGTPTSGGCSPVVAGAAFDARPYSFIRANGSVVGTLQQVPVTVAWVTLGDTSIPGRYYWEIADTDIEKAFSPSLNGDGLTGAAQAIEVAVECSGPSTIEIPLFVGTVSFINSAFGSS